MTQSDQISHDIDEFVTPDPFTTESQWEFTLQEGGRWFAAYGTATEILNLLTTGMIEGKPVFAVRVVHITCEDESKVWMIYDFVLAKRGLPAWRLQHEPA
jgi:hypothetical protein